jgi:uncharacterized integral membrane protein (TIGR00698 family)
MSLPIERVSNASMRYRPEIPGIVLSATIAAIAMAGSLLGGSPVVWGLLTGLGIATIWSPGPKFLPGLTFASKQVMRIGVALLGFQISLATLRGLEASDILAVAMNVAVILTLGVVVGWAIGIRRELALVAAASVAICGASAAAAFACIVMRDDSSDRDVACTIGAVSVLSTLAMILYPLVARHIGMGFAAGGIFLGGSIHEVAHAVAAGYSINSQTGDMATMAKLLRVALLAPACVVISMLVPAAFEPRRTALPLPPTFLVAFVGAALLNAAGLIPEQISHAAAPLSRYCLVVSMVAIGMTLPWRNIKGFGLRPVLLLVVLSCVLVTLSLLYATHRPL